MDGKDVGNGIKTVFLVLRAGSISEESKRILRRLHIC